MKSILCFYRHQRSHTDPTTVRTLKSLVMAKAPDHKISVSSALCAVELLAFCIWLLMSVSSYVCIHLHKHILIFLYIAMYYIAS